MGKDESGFDLLPWQEEVRKRLLEDPKATVDSLTEWLGTNNFGYFPTVPELMAEIRKLSSRRVESNRETDFEKVTGLAKRLHEICGALDDIKVQMVDMIPTWVHTAQASPLIQAMAHVDSAIRTLEKQHRDTSKAIVKLKAMGEDLDGRS